MKTLGRLIRLVRPHAGQVAAAAALGAATVASGIGLMGTAAYLIASAALQPSIADLQVAIVGVRFFGLSRGIFRYLERLTSHRLTLDLLSRLRVWFYGALEPLAPARTLSLRSSDLLTRAVNDVESLQGLYLRALAPPLVALAVVIGTGAFLAGFDRLPAMVFVSAFAVAGIGVPLAVSRLARPVGIRLAAIRADLAATVVDGVQGMADLVACGRAGAQLDRLVSLSFLVARKRLRVSRIEAFGSATTTFATHGTVWIVLVVSIPLVRAGVFDGISLAVISLVVMAAFEALQPLPVAAQHLSEQLAAARRVFAIVDSRPEVCDPSDPAPIIPAAGEALLELRQLGFTYPGRSEAALRGLDLELKTGGRLGIVGPSGAGKSTLAHLLLRFWDPSSGDILLAGRSLADYNLDNLRKFVGVLSQRTDLFTGTIRENLLLASPEATDEDLEAAADRAELLSTVRNLPDGWDTWIGENGLHLSGGQRQRLSIARLLLRNPRLLVLDEPASGLDPVTEMRLLGSLRGVMDGRTTIHITHRLVAMEEMDEILVLDLGRVVQRGSHQELLLRDGLYRQLFESQNLVVREG